MGKKAAYFICNDRSYGHVSHNVWDILKEEGYMNTCAGFEFDGGQVFVHTDDEENQYYFVPTKVAVCLEYERLLPELNMHFADFDVTGMVTWHEGTNAPDNVFTVHSLGDVNSGIYGAANPRYMRNLMLAMEENRKKAGLENYSVVTEATHWSGAFGEDSDPGLLLDFPVPMMDIEVGSNAESWNDMAACSVLAKSLVEIFKDDNRKVHNILCLGGVHFEPNFAEAVFSKWGNDTFGVTHIIANQWLVSGEYEKEDGIDRVLNAVNVIQGGVEAIVFHDKMKGCYKDLARKISDKYGISAYKHQKLRTPEELF